MQGTLAKTVGKIKDKEDLALSSLICAHEILNCVKGIIDVAITL
jgi:hypothetical protein